MPCARLSVLFKDGRCRCPHQSSQHLGNSHFLHGFVDCGGRIEVGFGSLFHPLILVVSWFLGRRLSDWARADTEYTAERVC